MSRLLARLGVVLAAAMAFVTGGGSIAAAHVTAHSDDAVLGHSAEITFRVPNESDSTSTVTVSLALPVETPIAEVAVLPQAGWTYEVTKTRLSAPLSTEDGEEVSEVVSRIDWHAATPDTAVKPGQYQVFRIVAGPLPRTDWLVFKVVQTYDDGQAKRWIDDPLADGEPPAHPAALLAVDSTTAAGHGHGQTANVVPAASSQSTTPGPAWWAAVALAVAALIAALVSVVVSIRTARRAGGDDPAG
jgi:uncharacterized protein YcnI